MTPQYEVAWEDISRGLLEWRVWSRLGWQEVKRRYRRTVLGPFWATFSLGMLLAGMAFIWARLFNTDVPSYMPFLAAGLVSWAFATSLIIEGCMTYVGGAGIISQTRFHYSILNFAVVWRNIIVLLHNGLIVVVVVLILPVKVTWSTLLVIPGAIIVAANGAWITVVLGIVSTRFRDIPPLVINLVQILLFVTPVFWFAHQLGEGTHRVIEYNYMYHLIEVMRAPMLGETPGLASYEWTIAGAAVGWLFAFDLFARFRRRIPYWL